MIIIQRNVYLPKVTVREIDIYPIFFRNDSGIYTGGIDIMAITKKRLNIALDMILRLYKQASEHPDRFHGSMLSQGYRDSLEAIKRAGLISGYNLKDMTIEYPDTVGGK